MNWNVTFIADDQASERIRTSVSRILDATALCTLATVSPELTPYANTCFFAVGDDFSLYILTPPTTRHSQNIEHNPRVSLTIFDSRQVSGAELQGLQLFGVCKPASGDTIEEALRVYSARFPGLREGAPDVPTLLSNFQSRFYKIIVDTVKVFDEIEFGKEVWITAAVKGDPR